MSALYSCLLNSALFRGGGGLNTQKQSASYGHVVPLVATCKWATDLSLLLLLVTSLWSTWSTDLSLLLLLVTSLWCTWSRTARLWPNPRCVTTCDVWSPVWATFIHSVSYTGTSSSATCCLMSRWNWRLQTSASPRTSPTTARRKCRSSDALNDSFVLIYSVFDTTCCRRKSYRVLKW